MCLTLPAEHHSHRAVIEKGDIVTKLKFLFIVVIVLFGFMVRTSARLRSR